MKKYLYLLLPFVLVLAIMPSSCVAQSHNSNDSLTWEYGTGLDCKENRVSYPYDKDSVRVPILKHALPRRAVDSICNLVTTVYQDEVDKKGYVRLRFLGQEYLYSNVQMKFTVVKIAKMGKRSGMYSYKLFVSEDGDGIGEHTSTQVIYYPKVGAVYAAFGIENLEVASLRKDSRLNKQELEKIYIDAISGYLTITCN